VPAEDGSHCQLQPGGESFVLAVLKVPGALLLSLADGRFLRLTEVFIPPRTSPLGFDPSSAAVDYLRKTALGHRVGVEFGGTKRDRYGVETGHAFVEDGAERIWLQEGLISAGLAEAYPQIENSACARELLSAEGAARAAKRGHWGVSLFKVIAANDRKTLLDLVQTYQIVEGTVLDAFGTTRLILTFGADSKSDFAVIIDPGAKRRFADKPQAASWKGVRVRVRGWMDRRRGPFIEVSQPEQVEFLPAPADSK
jgi:hypothetical protein